VTEPSDRDDRLLSIGVFARRSRLSMRALRLYDRQGLLKPDRIDSHNGYRRYRESQLFIARLISLLRQLDMPLARLGNWGERRTSSATEEVFRDAPVRSELAVQSR
jgi:DNA-binding transcriptional MerR regulator